MTSSPTIQWHETITDKQWQAHPAPEYDFTISVSSGDYATFRVHRRATQACVARHDYVNLHHAFQDADLTCDQLRDR